MKVRGLFNAARTLAVAVLATFMAFGSGVRVVPLLFSSTPGTVLRVLCIMAFDYLHWRRRRRLHSRGTLRMLGALLDFGASANAVLDHKRQASKEFGASLQMLEQGSIGPSLALYVRRLTELERGRPLPFGNDAQFQNVRVYREEVVRLSLGMLATTAGLCRSLEEGIDATHWDDDLNLLFRMVMLCQIIDDVLDYPADLAAALPSFLTGSFLVSRAIELTGQSARDYGELCRRPVAVDLFPLRLALALTAVLTTTLMGIARYRQVGSALSTDR